MSDADARSPSPEPQAVRTHGSTARWPAPGDVVVATCALVRDLGTGEGRTRVLHGIDIEVREREFVSLTGASGSGKSTLLYLLGALDRPTSGSVVIDGVDVGSLDDDARALVRSDKLGFVFQFHFLLPEFTVFENVVLPMYKRGHKPRAACDARARDVLAALGLAELSERRPSQLSGGQQQRVSIARAVANEPRLLLADEPTGNLDSRNGEIVMSVFEGLVRDQGLTVVMVTHERGFAARASRQIVLRDGRVESDVAQSGD
jgi:lipoprotein-releasing system ATP-binding protein